MPWCRAVRLIDCFLSLSTSVRDKNFGARWWRVWGEWAQDRIPPNVRLILLARLGLIRRLLFHLVYMMTKAFPLACVPLLKWIVCVTRAPRITLRSSETNNASRKCISCFSSQTTTTTIFNYPRCTWLRHKPRVSITIMVYFYSFTP